MRATRSLLHALSQRPSSASPSKLHAAARAFNTSRALRQSPAGHELEDRPVNFYRSHGRALFKALTLAFFSYQVVYWSWLTLETEELKANKDQEIKSLETQVRLLDETRKGQSRRAED
ncbi:hypothetical protein LTR84_003551 [Exophiala bonariae]|uniref:Uncharacterized protein n=1 Tax=Exophiala bonariae TaxID=1690606 RepID=A0AAV9N7I6_9EURO|nr:hypothetical protein LTR84_003551 [Exophiala bonariae]